MDFIFFTKKIVVAVLLIAFLVIYVFKTAQFGSQEVDLNRYHYVAHARDITATMPPDPKAGSDLNPFSLVGWLIKLGLW